MKKILSTKPHLVVFFLALIYWPLNYLMWMRIGTWNLNRTIGWGWDITNFIYWIMPTSIFSIFIFSFVYWILSVKKYEFNFVLILLQVVGIVLAMVSIIPFHYFFGELLLCANWLLFFANVIAALFFGKNERSFILIFKKSLRSF